MRALILSFISNPIKYKNWMMEWREANGRRPSGHVTGNLPIKDADLDQTIDCFIVTVTCGPLLVQTHLPVTMTTQILDKAGPAGGCHMI